MRGARSRQAQNLRELASGGPSSAQSAARPFQGERRQRRRIVGRADSVDSIALLKASAVRKAYDKVADSRVACREVGHCFSQDIALPTDPLQVADFGTLLRGRCPLQGPTNPVPRVESQMLSSRATCVMLPPASLTMATASALNSSVNFRRGRRPLVVDVDTPIRPHRPQGRCPSKPGQPQRGSFTGALLGIPLILGPSSERDPTYAYLTEVRPHE